MQYQAVVSVYTGETTRKTMRKYIILLFISAFALGACDKNDDYTVREWTVASQLGISHGFHTLQPGLLVKANDDTSWRAVYERIAGFDYEDTMSRILFAGDHEYRTFLSERLSRDGHRVTPVSRLRDIMENPDGDPCDVVVASHALPVSDKQALL